MIIIDWKRLDQAGQLYVNRLLDYAKRHSRSYLARRVIGAIGVQSFRDLILCSPMRLGAYPCPPGLSSSDVYKVYDLFFRGSGEDGVNNAIWFTKMLNINVCPYCNHSYIFTIRKGPKVRPELDHFFPRSNIKYRHLALSFYNLIPSCPSCNHTKSTSLFDFHPYYGSLNKGALMPVFRVDTKNASYNEKGHLVLFPEKPEILLDNPNNNTRLLGLNELYKNHSDYAKEIMDKIVAYNVAMYEPLIAGFQGIGRTPEEIDRLVWGNYLEAAQQTKRPLSKLTQDLLGQFGLL